MILLIDTQHTDQSAFLIDLFSLLIGSLLQTLLIQQKSSKFEILV